MTKNFILVGSSSDLANDFINILKNKGENVVTISSSAVSDIKVENYITDLNKIVNNLNEMNNLIVIFFNGFLAENRPIKFPTDKEIKNTEYINFSIPYLITEELVSKGINVYKYVYISSIAAIKPRYKNFLYGLAKNKLEDNISKLVNNYLIFRFGKIQTKMSSTHADVPFTLSSSEAAEIIYNKIDEEKIIYPNFKLKLFSLLLYAIPSKILDFIERKLTSSGK